MRNIVWLLAICLLGGTMMSCKKSVSTEEQLQKDIEIIKSYIEDHGLTAEHTDSGLYYVVEKEGTGNYPTANDKVRVRYVGYTTDGKNFDESPEEGIAFNLQNVIKGWTEGMQKFKEGGKGKLLIPSSLAYGEQGNSAIAPNTVLIFDVELLTIES